VADEGLLNFVLEINEEKKQKIPLLIFGMWGKPSHV